MHASLLLLLATVVAVWSATTLAVFAFSSFWGWALALYGAGMAGTWLFNLVTTPMISRPWVVIRNAVLWPCFLPILIILRRH